MLDKVICAFESAAGINMSKVNTKTGGMTYIPKKKDFSELQKLYKDPEAKHLIDKFLEIGNIDKSAVDL